MEREGILIIFKMTKIVANTNAAKSDRWDTKENFDYVSDTTQPDPAMVMPINATITDIRVTLHHFYNYTPEIPENDYYLTF